jgi:hypothetical protein
MTGQLKSCARRTDGLFTIYSVGLALKMRLCWQKGMVFLFLKKHKKLVPASGKAGTAF